VEYFSRLRKFWFPNLNALWWLLLAFPGLYTFQTTIHEGTHGVVAWMNNGDFPKVAPFPHLTPDGNFLNGVTIPDKPETVRERRSAIRGGSGSGPAARRLDWMAADRRRAPGRGPCAHLCGL
jgi:hypothetical protein